MNYHKYYKKFLTVRKEFSLGHLITEKPHPLTKNLSYLANHDLVKAIEVLKAADVIAFKKLLRYLSRFEKLKTVIKNVITQGGKVFICGCGATGRLALTLEMLWKNQYKDTEYENLCLGFMAGGDYGLVKAVENAEDRSQWSIRQIKELNFSKNDLLIGCTEGGETPYVLSCVQYASEISVYKPYLIYCNPDYLLMRIQRCAKILQNDKISKISLNIGPMSITGSTRLQACSVIMLALGEALLNFIESQNIIQNIYKFINILEQIDYSFLDDLIIKESQAYKDKHSVFYQTNEFGILILSDTAERTPTFNIKPFKNIYDQYDKAPCFCHLNIINTISSAEAWHKILSRFPRGLEWKCLNNKVSYKSILGFDFSDSFFKRHKKIYKNIEHHVFKILKNKNNIIFQFDKHVYKLKYYFKSNLHIFILLKMILNILSNLTMGRLHRYENNIMFWVKPSNYKLIDRCIRYVQFLCEQNKIKKISYNMIANLTFDQMRYLKDDESLIFKVYEYIKTLKIN